MGQVVYIQTTGSHIGSYQQLQVTLAEFLHHQVTLCLAQFAVQGVGIVAVLYQLVGYLLCFFTGTAEDDTVNLRIKVYHAFQCQVFVFGMDDVCDVVDVLAAFVLGTDGDFLGIVQVSLGNAGNLGTHGSREHQGVPVLRYFFQDGVDAVCETHVQHFIGFVHHDIADRRQVGHLTFHQVDEASRCGHDDVYPLFQATYLAVDGGTTVYRQYFQIGDILRVVCQVTGYLQTEFAGRTENQCLWNTTGYVNLLNQRQTKCGCFSGSGLCQSHYIVSVS